MHFTLRLTILGNRIKFKRLEPTVPVIAIILYGIISPESIQTDNSGYALYNIRERLCLFYPSASLHLETDETTGVTSSIIEIIQGEEKDVQNSAHR